MTDLIQMSRQAASDAHFMFDAKRYDGAVTRAYYAIYHAARAALIFTDPEFTEAKTHKGLLQQFSRLVIVQQKQDAALGKAMRRLLKARIEVDYEARPATPQSAEEVLKSMDEFLTTIVKFIETNPR